MIVILMLIIVPVILGMWADDSDNEGNDRTRNTRGRPDYTSGVSFVSGGIQQPSKSKEDNKEEENGEDESIPVTDSSRYLVNFGANINCMEHVNTLYCCFFLNSSEDEAVAIPKAFGKKVEHQLNETAGLRTRQHQGTGGKAMGMFGIGAQLALKMGWQPGKGLGKDEQGITAPIEAVVRKGRGAIGM